MVQETDLAYLFAGLLAASSALFLFFPLLRRVWLFSPRRPVYVLVLAGLVALVVGAIALVFVAISDPVYFAPVVAIAAILRIGSPPLLYRTLRDRFMTFRWWRAIRVVALGVFVGLAGFLAVHLLLGSTAGTAVGAVVLSEQLITAAGASLLVTRFALRVRPKDRAHLWPVWFAALLFSIAFVVVAPYASPTFAVAYIASGIMGWLLGAGVLWRDPA